MLLQISLLRLPSRIVFTKCQNLRSVLEFLSNKRHTRKILCLYVCSQRYFLAEQICTVNHPQRATLKRLTVEWFKKNLWIKINYILFSLCIYDFTGFGFVSGRPPPLWLQYINSFNRSINIINRKELGKFDLGWNLKRLEISTLAYWRATRWYCKWTIGSSLRRPQRTYRAVT